MNGIHDLGGMHGFGPVRPTASEPVFHHAWEGRVLALMRTILYTRTWNIDVFRFAQEQLPAQTYLSVSYYHRWFLGLHATAVQRGLVHEQELLQGHASHSPATATTSATTPTPQRRLELGSEAAVFVRGNFERPATSQARFKPGDVVRTHNLNPSGHTRLPRYARGKLGQVQRVHGCHVFPDSAAAGQGENPQWLYTVAFSGPNLWGPDADPSLSVCIEAFEPYLEPA